MSVETVFAAIGDPTRREIVQMLSRSDATVNELAEPFSMTLQAVAKHVRILESAGVIRKKKIGRSHHCSLRADTLAEARAWLDDLERDWSERLDRLGAFLDETSDSKDGKADDSPAAPRTAGRRISGDARGSALRNGRKNKRTD